MNVIGIGTDIIEVLRIAQMLQKHGELFTGRVFTEAEVLYCGSRAAANQHYAGRWAAKEAALKAMGTGWAQGVKWTDIEVVHLLGGKPAIKIHDAAKRICQDQGIEQILISISHCRSFAIAYATAVGFPPADSNS